MANKLPWCDDPCYFDKGGHPGFGVRSHIPLAGLELTVHFWRKRVPEPKKVSRKRALEDESSDEEAGRSRQRADLSAPLDP